MASPDEIRNTRRSSGRETRSSGNRIGLLANTEKPRRGPFRSPSKEESSTSPTTKTQASGTSGATSKSKNKGKGREQGRVTVDNGKVYPSFAKWVQNSHFLLDSVDDDAAGWNGGFVKRQVEELEGNKNSNGHISVISNDMDSGRGNEKPCMAREGMLNCY